MKEVTGNIWDYYDNGYIACITTNRMLKKDGSLVMGKGVALQAKDKIPFLPKILGKQVKNNLYLTCYLSELRSISFPVKYHWKDKADLTLIKKSAIELSCLSLALKNRSPGKNIYLPRLGCGLGGLDYKY